MVQASLTEHQTDTSQERKRLYAAGVLSIDATGCLPLCGGWDFQDMLNFFPNAQRIRFSSAGIEWSREPTREGRSMSSNRFTITHRLAAQDGVVAQPRPFHPPPGFAHEVQHCLASTHDAALRVRPFTRGTDGEVLLPEILLLPLHELDTMGIYPTQEDWLAILRQRQRLGIATRTITWMPLRAQDLIQFANAAGPHVQELRLNALTFTDDLSRTLSDILSALQGGDKMPNLEHLVVTLQFFGNMEPSQSEVQAVETLAFSSWLRRDIPNKLDLITLILICAKPTADGHSFDDGSGDATTAPSAIEDNERSARPIEVNLPQALPAGCVRDIKVIHGDRAGIRVKMKMLHDNGDGVRDWDEPFGEFFAGRNYYGPVSISRSPQTAGMCICAGEA